ncbi:MAG: hypothetical protein JNM03_09600 [Sphingopyxis sp.]|uniref:hypothetical protein n=1 Tax=Sphingopyxis sp. TaxID=1908224 RepID=UPI001A3AF383|nr:hypothetical protein [Sphingopyxis sp.]MBL9070232.1 hypothetical protein [Sphingopyxis sp.]
MREEAAWASACAAFCVSEGGPKRAAIFMFEIGDSEPFHIVSIRGKPLATGSITAHLDHFALKPFPRTDNRPSDQLFM